MEVSDTSIRACARNNCNSVTLQYSSQLIVSVILCMLRCILRLEHEYIFFFKSVEVTYVICI